MDNSYMDDRHVTMRNGMMYAFINNDEACRLMSNLNWYDVASNLFKYNDKDVKFSLISGRVESTNKKDFRLITLFKRINTPERLKSIEDIEDDDFVEIIKNIYIERNSKDHLEYNTIEERTIKRYKLLFNNHIDKRKFKTLHISAKSIQLKDEITSDENMKRIESDLEKAYTNENVNERKYFSKKDK